MLTTRSLLIVLIVLAINAVSTLELLTQTLSKEGQDQKTIHEYLV